MEFYELQQVAGGRWTHLGFFRTAKGAREHEKRFNTKTQVHPTRIVERCFQEERVEKDIIDDDSHEFGGC